MNQLFLLKLIADLLKDSPTKEQIICANKILEGMIKEYDVPLINAVSTTQINSNLDPEAIQAQRELMG